MNTINNLDLDFDTFFNNNDNLSDEFYSNDCITREETDQFHRQISLMKIEITDLKVENKKIAVLEIKYNMLVGHNKDLCYQLKRLEKENKKLKKQIRPNVLRRIWRKIKKTGYNQM